MFKKLLLLLTLRTLSGSRSSTSEFTDLANNIARKGLLVCIFAFIFLPTSVVISILALICTLDSPYQMIALVAVAVFYLAIFIFSSAIMVRLLLDNNKS